MGLIKDEKLSYYGGLSKNHIFRGVHKKPIYKGKFPKRWAWTVCRFEGSLEKKKGVVFFRRVDTPMRTMIQNILK